jgi:protein O-GlcNAc transferase
MKSASQLTLGFLLAATLTGAIHANPTNADFATLLQAGTEESLRGDLVRAAADLEAALSLEPRSADAWFQLGLLYSKSTNFRNAEMAFRKAVEYNSHLPQAHFWLGWTLIIDPQSKLDWAGAVAESQAALADKPDYADALNLLGAGLINLGQLDKAVEVLQPATAIKPPSASAHFNLGMALEKLGRTEEAIKQYEAAVAIKNDYPQASSALGKLLLSMGKPAEAEQPLLQALRQNPDLPDAHYALARTLQALKKTSAAKVEFDEAADLIQLQPDGIQAMNMSNESLAQASQGDFGGATQSLRHAIALKPDYGVPHYNLGLILADSGDMNGAIRELSVAISLMPGQAKPWFDLGRVFEKQGDGKRAFEAYSWAARLSPSDPAMRVKVKSFISVAPPGKESPPLEIPSDTAEDHLAAAQSLLREGQSLDAVSELLRALTLSPTDEEARRHLAGAYVSLGDFDKAILEYHKLLLLSPKDVSTHLVLGKLLLKQGHAEQAASQFRTALTYQPDSHEARASLAEALRASAGH